VLPSLEGQDLSDLALKILPSDLAHVKDLAHVQILPMLKDLAHAE